jgi:hypothetical protein
MPKDTIKSVCDKISYFYFTHFTGAISNKHNVSYICRKEKKKNRPVSRIEVEKTLNDKLNDMDVKDFLRDMGISLVFKKCHVWCDKSLYASLRNKKYILLNDNWAYTIFTEDTDTIRYPFRGTIGHELSHMNNDTSSIYFSYRLGKFVRWVNEVYNDFYGGELLLQSSREELEKSVDYKMKSKFPKRKRKKNTYSYPSWKNRCYYVRHYNFSDELLKQIATHCKVNTNSYKYNLTCEHIWEKKHPIILFPDITKERGKTPAF